MALASSWGLRGGSDQCTIILRVPCVFCQRDVPLTAEHVFPQWTRPYLQDAAGSRGVHELERTVHDRETKIEELRREKAALESEQESDDSARRWLRGQVFVVREDARVHDPGVTAWPPNHPGRGPSEVDQAVTERLRHIAGHAPGPTVSVT